MLVIFIEIKAIENEQCNRQCQFSIWMKKRRRDLRKFNLWVEQWENCHLIEWIHSILCLSHVNSCLKLIQFSVFAS